MLTDDVEAAVVGIRATVAERFRLDLRWSYRPRSVLMESDEAQAERAWAPRRRLTAGRGAPWPVSRQLNPAFTWPSRAFPTHCAVRFPLGTTTTRQAQPRALVLLLCVLALGAAPVVSACASADVPAPSDAEATAEAGGAGADRGEAVPASGRQEADPPATASTTPAETLEETRLALGKWIETQQVISKERRDWQQGKDVLAGRLELAEQEVATLEEKIAQNGASVAEADRKRDELLAEKEQLDAALAQLGVAVAAMEREVRTLFTQIPEPLQRKVQPLYQRIPEDPANTRSTAAERFQNVLGILNELNKANHEITVGYEVHTLADGKPAEVKTIYVGLAQAFYVSGGGESGIGRPGPDGWEWQPAKTASDEILMALEILQGKQTPAFVPLPMKIQ